MNLEKITNELVEKIKDLQPDTETTILKLIENDSISNYSSEDLFNIYKSVIKKCEEENIELSFDKYKNQVVGLPYNIPFIKK